MKTKKLCIAAILAVAIPLAAEAQTHLKKATADFLNGNGMDEYINSKSTEKGEDYNFNITYFSIPKSKSASLKQVMKAFEQDANNAYGSFTKNAGKEMRETKVIAYGKDNRQSVTFGTRRERNYKLAYFRDKADQDFRTVYALVWYDEKDGNTSGSLWIIYGKDPKISKGFISWDFNDLKQLKELKNMDWDSFTFPRTDSVSSAKEFLSRFGSLRELYKNAEREQDSDLYRTSMANKIRNLCKSGGKYLNPDEKRFVIEGINDLKKYCYDKYRKGLFDLAIRYLK